MMEDLPLPPPDDLLQKLDGLARDYESYEYGLPLHETECDVLGKMRDAVRTYGRMVQERCAVPEGFVLVPIEPTPEMVEAAGEELYGHPREKAEEWAKADKFESAERVGTGVYRAMIAAAIKADSSDPQCPTPD
jgi:hypothetical protein